MALQYNPRPKEDGLPRPGKNSTQVPMMSLGSLPTSPTKEYSTLWTQSMADCTTVATFNIHDGSRDMLHIMGGLTDDAYFIRTARHVQPGTVIILVPGSFWSKNGLGDWSVNYRRSFMAAWAAEGKPAAQAPEFRTFFGDRDLRVDSFVLRPDGEYGLINPALPVRDDKDEKCSIS